MSLWKRELQLSDCDPDASIEITCRVCGLMRYETVAALIANLKSRQLCLDQVEQRLRCRARACDGNVRIALAHDDRSEGFVGGMA